MKNRRYVRGVSNFRQKGVRERKGKKLKTQNNREVTPGRQQRVPDVKKGGRKNANLRRGGLYTKRGKVRVSSNGRKILCRKELTTSQER